MATRKKDPDLQRRREIARESLRQDGRLKALNSTALVAEVLNMSPDQVSRLSKSGELRTAQRRRSKGSPLMHPFEAIVDFVAEKMK